MATWSALISRLGSALLIALALMAPAQRASAQTAQAIVVATCGTPSLTYLPGFPYPVTMNPAGQVCTASSGGGGGSTTITGPLGTQTLAASVATTVLAFRPAAYGTPITATTSGVSGTLPAGAEVVATNIGTTNVAYCALGASATASSQPITPNGGWFAFAIAGDTQLTCITATGTTTVNLAGGTGLPTGTGGGGGGSGSGASGGGTGLPFIPTSGTSNVVQSVTTTSSTPAALPAGTYAQFTYIAGTQPAYVVLSTSSSCTATTAGFYVGPGNPTWVTYVGTGAGAYTYFCAITASGTATLQVAGGSVYFTVQGAAPYAGTPTGYQQITSLSASSATTVTVPATSTYCALMVEIEPIRFRDDGVAPTATVGMPVPITTSTGAAQIIQTSGLSQWEIISQTAGATVDISCYK